MPRMPSPRGPKGPGIRFKIEHVDSVPIDQLVEKLAQELHNASKLDQDANAFSAHAQNERRKAQNLQNVLFQLKERKRNGYVQVRRMDPLAEYDEDSVKDELELAKKRVESFTSRATEFRQKAAKLREDASETQKRIKNHRKEV